MVTLCFGAVWVEKLVPGAMRWRRLRWAAEPFDLFGPAQADCQNLTGGVFACCLFGRPSKVACQRAPRYQKLRSGIPVRRVARHQVMLPGRKQRIVIP